MAVESMKLGEVAELLGGELRGDAAIVVRAIAPIDHAGPETITFVANPKYVGRVSTTRAAAVLVSPDVAEQGSPEGTALIVLDDPYKGFARLLHHWTQEPREVRGVSERAAVDPSARLGAEVNVWPLAYVGPGAVLGDRVDVHPGAYVGAGAEVGAETSIGPNAVVHARCRIGARCQVYAGAVIGADGFGFVPDPLTGRHMKIPQVGIVVLEDEVEVGANTTIDRAVLGETRIGRGTKIDNQVQIAHNVSVGAGCFLVSQTGVAGSSQLGNGVTLAAQAGVAGHLTVGDGAIIGAQAGVHADVDAGARMLGSPAIKGSDAKRSMAVFPKLPELRRRLRDVEKRLAQLDGAAGDQPLPGPVGSTSPRSDSQSTSDRLPR